MKSMNKGILAAVAVAALLYTPKVLSRQASATPAPTETQNTNIRTYVELLRSDIKTQKSVILAEMMQLSDEQSDKFWPIYREYDHELQALNDQKLAGIMEYAKIYNSDSMNDDKADELASLALDLENNRNEVKRKYYEKMRDSLGGIVAARFLQVENQMLMIIDLQIASSLPIVSQ
jgi:hypothetical protein